MRALTVQALAAMGRLTAARRARARRLGNREAERMTAWVSEHPTPLGARLLLRLHRAERLRSRAVDGDSSQFGVHFDPPFTARSVSGNLLAR